MEETEESKGELETIVMCVRSGTSEACPGQECPAYNGCWEQDKNKYNYKTQE